MLALKSVRSYEMITAPDIYGPWIPLRFVDSIGYHGCILCIHQLGIGEIGYTNSRLKRKMEKELFYKPSSETTSSKKHKPVFSQDFMEREHTGLPSQSSKHPTIYPGDKGRGMHYIRRANHLEYLKKSKESKEVSPP